jgi:hypothetical protein
MRTNFKRVALSIAALTAASTGLVLSSTTATAAGTLAGPATLSPLSGGLTTNYTLNPPPNSFCAGDSAAGGYSVRTFMTDQDPTTLSWSGAGPATASGFTQPLFTATGSPITAVNTAPAAPGAVTGRILSLGNLRFEALGPGTIPNGSYTLGIACVVANETDTFYSTQVTFTNDNWAFGAVPAAPVLGVATYDAGTGTATVNLTHAASVPATTGYTATLTPVGAAAPIAPIAVPAGATSFQIPGVALGAEYTVSLVANNATGPSAPSNTITVVGATTESVVVSPVPAVFEGADVTISWTAPATAPTDYTVAIAGQPPINEAGTSTVVSGLAAGDYTVVVTPNYPSGSGITGVASAPVSFTVQLNTLLYQDITVERPAGNLVLTQRCGVYGAFPAFDTTGWPGAGLTLDPVVAVDGPGTAPTVVGGPNDGDPDPLFTSYPQRGTYPTLCGVNLGEGELVTSGPLAGRYYVADGQINQVTVLDARDGDLGWTARGDIADLFTSGPGPFDENNSFSGDFLGWFPQVTSSSTGQLVTAGPEVGPGTTGGLTGNPTLASAPSGSGLGIATLDARLAVIIPVAADADTYTARLSLTVA